MKIISIQVVVALLSFAVFGCSEARKEDKLTDIIASFGFHVVDMADSNYETIDKLESLDRTSYAPVSFERARIRSDVELDAYHGPTKGNFYLSIETYQTNEDAEKRASEYRDWERFASVVGFDDPHDLGKTSLRCWSYPVGSRVYLLSTHAAMQTPLANTVLSGIKAYEERRGEQAGTGQPATRPELKSEGGDKPQSEAEGRSR